MTTGISKSSSPIVLRYQFDSYMKNSNMYILRNQDITVASLEMFILKIEGGDLAQYTKIQNVKQDWLNIENPDVYLCDYDFLKRYTNTLFKQDYFVFKSKKKTRKPNSRIDQLVKNSNTSKINKNL